MTLPAIPQVRPASSALASRRGIPIALNPTGNTNQIQKR